MSVTLLAAWTATAVAAILVAYIAARLTLNVYTLATAPGPELEYSALDLDIAVQNAHDETSELVGRLIEQIEAAGLKPDITE